AACGVKIIARDIAAVAAPGSESASRGQRIPNLSLCKTELRSQRRPVDAVVEFPEGRGGLDPVRMANMFIGHRQGHFQKSAAAYDVVWSPGSSSEQKDERRGGLHALQQRPEVNAIFLLFADQRFEVFQAKHGALQRSFPDEQPYGVLERRRAAGEFLYIGYQQ